MIKNISKLKFVIIPILLIGCMSTAIYVQAKGDENVEQQSEVKEVNFNNNPTDDSDKEITTNIIEVKKVELESTSDKTNIVITINNLNQLENVGISEVVINVIVYDENQNEILNINTNPSTLIPRNIPITVSYTTNKIDSYKDVKAKVISIKKIVT